MVVRELDDQLLRPLSWKRPYSVFACAEGDLFHKKISTAFIHKVFAVMESCPEHRFVLITKRAERMEEVLTDPGFAVKVSEVGEALLGERYRNRGPLWGDNIVIGVSVEDQAHMERSLILPRLPATMTKAIFVAPMLGPVTIPLSVLETLGWVLCNGERGNKWCEPRPCKLEWQQDLAFQCEAADVPFFLLRRLHRAWIEQLGGKRYLDLPKILTAA
jgi:protein gp37